MYYIVVQARIYIVIFIRNLSLTLLSHSYHLNRAQSENIHDRV